MANSFIRIPSSSSGVRRYTTRDSWVNNTVTPGVALVDMTTTIAEL
jgi:hypothetical protein